LASGSTLPANQSNTRAVARSTTSAASMATLATGQAQVSDSGVGAANRPGGQAPSVRAFSVARHSSWVVAPRYRQVVQSAVIWEESGREDWDGGSEGISVGLPIHTHPKAELTMSMTEPGRTTRGAEVRGDATDTLGGRRRSRWLETKPFAMTSEFWLTVAGIAAVLIVGYVIHDDEPTFNLFRAWMLATIIASAYIVSRGLAKSGSSRNPYDDYRR
jgi:hypothetical protein